MLNTAANLMARKAAGRLPHGSEHWTVNAHNESQFSVFGATLYNQHLGLSSEFKDTDT